MAVDLGTIDLVLKEDRKSQLDGSAGGAVGGTPRKFSSSGSGIGSLASGATKALAVVGLATAALAGITAASKKLTDTLLNDASRLARVSPILAAAEASATLRQLSRDIQSGYLQGGILSTLRAELENTKDILNPVVSLLKNAASVGIVQTLRLFNSVLNTVVDVSLAAAQGMARLAQIVSQAGLSIIGMIPESMQNDALSAMRRGLLSMNITMSSMEEQIKGIRKDIQDEINGGKIRHINESFLRDLDSLSGSTIPIAGR